ncbi:diphthamide synthesis protein [Candidatus Woesearchaeota archaeon]|nr:diphthamide synthesis protein [Candidatus Woesearchaeota archaeon]
MQTSQYDLEIEKAVAKIKEESARLVCIQLPDGLKPYAAEIQQQLEGKTDAKVVIWAGSCYGACDAAVEAQRLGVDLLIQWGHAEWR